MTLSYTCLILASASAVPRWRSLAPVFWWQRWEHPASRATNGRLSWIAAPGAVEYSVRRSLITDLGAAVEIGTTDDLFFEDVNAVLDGSSYAYRVFPLNACGQEAP